MLSVSEYRKIHAKNMQRSMNEIKKEYNDLTLSSPIVCLTQGEVIIDYSELSNKISDQNCSIQGSCGSVVVYR